jgi:hypothetical protein
MIIDLKFVVKCEILSLDEIFKAFVLAMLLQNMSIYYHYKKICRNLKFVSINSAQSGLHKCITWSKKWNNVCSNSNLAPRKLNI